MMNRDQHRHKTIHVCAFILLFLQVITILTSWIYGALYPQLNIRTLISAEGLRWYIGCMTDNIAQQPVAWIILLSMTWGILTQSCLPKSLCKLKRGENNYMEKFALKISFWVFLSTIAIIIYLSATPHAILQSITGDVIPGSLSHGSIPILCVMVGITASVYGFLSGNFNRLSDLFESCAIGISIASRYWVLYLLFIQLYCSIKFVLV